MDVLIIFVLVLAAMAAMLIYSTTPHYKKRLRASQIAQARVRRIGYEKFAVRHRPEAETPRPKKRRRRRRRRRYRNPYLELANAPLKSGRGG